MASVWDEFSGDWESGCCYCYEYIISKSTAIEEAGEIARENTHSD